MEPLQSQPQFSAWQIIILLLLLVLTTLGQPLVMWLFPMLSVLISEHTLQILFPLVGIGFITLLFEQWGVIQMRPYFMNSGLTLPLLASFALLYPLISYF
jgi:hypothetical protein